MAPNQVEGAVDRATDSETFELAARAGYAISGVLHLLVGYIILRIAIGFAGTADHSGALEALAHSGGGPLVLWAAAAGLAALGLWRLAETVVGPHPSEHSGEQPGRSRVTKRLKSFGMAVLYLFIAYLAALFAVGSGERSGTRNAGLSAQLMQSGWGKFVLVVIGLAVVGAGGYHVYKGATRSFLKDLTVSGGPLLTPVGIAGYVAKGLVLAGAGILVVVATFTSDPAKASGVDGALKTFGTAPFGKVLLVLAALGIGSFGLYTFARSRHGRM